VIQVRDPRSSTHAPAACPRCLAQMSASERVLQRRDQPGLRVGLPVPPRRTVMVWHCAACGIDWPRFE
jgi:hypothetical protein